MSQQDLVIEYLKHNTEISTITAFEQLGIKDLPKIINELRQNGYVFAYCKVEDDGKSGRKYKKYILRGTPDK